MRETITVENARKAYEKKDYALAARLYGEAAEQIDPNGDLLTKAELLNNCSVAWLQAGEPQKSWEAVQGTDLVFEKAQDPCRQAMALGNQASALEALGSLPEAMEKYQAAADMLKDLQEDDLRAYVLQNLAALQLRNGDQLQSLATMHTALENKKKLGVKEKLLKKLLRVPFKMMR